MNIVYFGHSLCFEESLVDFVVFLCGKQLTTIFMVEISWIEQQLCWNPAINSTQLTTPKEEWVNKRKEAKKLIYIPDSLVNSLDVS